MPEEQEPNAYFAVLDDRDGSIMLIPTDDPMLCYASAVDVALLDDYDPSKWL